MVQRTRARGSGDRENEGGDRVEVRRLSRRQRAPTAARRLL